MIKLPLQDHSQGGTVQPPAWSLPSHLGLPTTNPLREMNLGRMKSKRSCTALGMVPWSLPTGHPVCPGEQWQDFSPCPSAFPRLWTPAAGQGFPALSKHAGGGWPVTCSQSAVLSKVCLKSWLPSVMCLLFHPHLQPSLLSYNLLPFLPVLHLPAPHTGSHPFTIG